MIGAHCLRCHAVAPIVLEMTPARVAELVRTFTVEHAHGSVTVSTPGPTKVIAPDRTGKCTWCSARGAHGLDEDGDRICQKCEAAR